MLTEAETALRGKSAHIVHAMWSPPVLEVEEELSSGERLVWSGQPRPGIRLRPSDALVIPFSIFWCGFIIVWEVTALTITAKDGNPVALVFPLFGIPFVAVGLYLVFGRFIVDARSRRGTFYGVTSERIIIVSGLFARRIKSLNLRTLSDISLTERRDGSGTITFGPSHPSSQWFVWGTWPGAGQYATPAFEMIDGAKEVYELIRQTQKSAT
jgi:hypothetical protein